MDRIVAVKAAGVYDGLETLIRYASAVEAAQVKKEVKPLKDLLERSVDERLQDLVNLKTLKDFLDESITNLTNDVSRDMGKPIGVQPIPHEIQDSFKVGDKVASMVAPLAIGEAEREVPVFVRYKLGNEEAVQIVKNMRVVGVQECPAHGTVALVGFSAKNHEGLIGECAVSTIKHLYGVSGALVKQKIREHENGSKPLN